MCILVLRNSDGVAVLKCLMSYLLVFVIRLTCVQSRPLLRDFMLKTLLMRLMSLSLMLRCCYWLPGAL